MKDWTHETQYLDCNRVRKNAYFCGEKGQYYESFDKNQLELPDNYDFGIYLDTIS